MFGLRQKLAFGFGGLLLILLSVSGLGIGVLIQHRGELDKFLDENWRSVEYGQAMINALEGLDDLAKSDRNASAVAPLVQEFESNLNLENHNITLRGESKLVAELQAAWGTAHDENPTTYRGALSIIFGAGAVDSDRVTALKALLRLSSHVKQADRAMMQLNLDNMKPLDGRVKAMSDRASRAMVILSVLGVLVAMAFIAVVGRSILQPIRAITQSAREIEQGNLDLVVQVNSHDELRQLAEAFNSMAAKLREYRRTHRAKMVRTQQTTQLAINSLPDVVAILSPDGTIDMANSAAQKLFGIRPESRVSESRLEWLVDLHKRTTESLRPVEPRGYDSALQVLDEGGGERFFLPHAVPILDEEKQLLGVTVVLADVTNLRRLDEMKSGMLSVVSHELRTPLTSIRMGVHLLLEERIGSLTPQQGDLLTAVRDDSDRLNGIVENLLDMGRIESGRALLDLQPEATAAVVEEATRPLHAAFHDRGVALFIDLPDDLPGILADRMRIGLVFSNLLTNALKYTAPGGQVRVTADAENEVVRFAVTDTGEGIAEKHLPHLFERFFRVPGQSGSSGAGLGLAITKDIVEAHGGQITVESHEGRGTTFSFTLRRADSESSTIRHAGENSNGNEREATDEIRTHTHR